MAVEQGDVYFTVHRGPTSPKPHFCIVVNGGADVTKRVVLSFASSQFETRLAIAKRNQDQCKVIGAESPNEGGRALGGLCCMSPILFLCRTKLGVRIESSAG